MSPHRAFPGSCKCIAPTIRSLAVRAGCQQLCIRRPDCIFFEQCVLCYSHQQHRAQRPVSNIIMVSNPQRQASLREHEAFQAPAERRLVNHKSVAKALRSAAPSVVDEIISLAYIQVAKWEDDSLCSKDYIAAWRELLKDPVAAAAVLEERSSRAAALRQNSPFVATVRKFQSLAHAV